MRSLSARWFAEEATAGAWAEALVVQPAVEDVEVAATCGDWATCVDCAVEALLAAGFVLAVLDGYQGSPAEVDLLPRLVRDRSPVVGLLDALPPAHAATEEDAATACRLVRTATALVSGAVPFQLPAMRTPEGFFPSVKMAADLEKLRTRLGLPGFRWEHWAT